MLEQRDLESLGVEVCTPLSGLVTGRGLNLRQDHGLESPKVSYLFSDRSLTTQGPPVDGRVGPSTGKGSGSPAHSSDFPGDVGDRELWVDEDRFSRRL